MVLAGCWLYPYSVVAAQPDKHSIFSFEVAPDLDRLRAFLVVSSDKAREIYIIC
jgi:hypothetical protein